MRKHVPSILLLAVFALFGYLVVRYSMAGEVTPNSKKGHRAGRAAADDGSLTASAPDARAKEDADAATLERPLHVASTRMELLAPGLLANGGARTEPGSHYDSHGLSVEFTTLDDLGQLDERDVDIAVVPLPTLVAAYEKLSDLQPTIFFVTGWWRGREALATPKAEALLGPGTYDDVELRGSAGETATFFSLFAMDLAGIPANTISITDETDSGYVAVDRASPEPETAPDGYKFVLSTADARGLIPYVAVAPRTLVDTYPQPLRTWTRGWLTGRETLLDDRSDAGRTIAKEDPRSDESAISERLNQMTFASLRDNAELAGASGGQKTPLVSLFELSWRLWREVGVLADPAPSSAPLSKQTIVALLRNHGEGLRTESDRSRELSIPAAKLHEFDEDVALVHRHLDSAIDENAFLDRLGIVAAAFPEARLEVTVDWNREKTEELIDRAVDRRGIERNRLQMGSKVPGPGPASIELLITR